MIDDIDGGEADRTVTFALDGTSYELDLSKSNAEELDKTLAPYVEKARRVSGKASSSTSTRSSSGRAGARTDKEQLKAIREWAKSNGYELSERGRIPAKVVEAYEAAH